MKSSEWDIIVCPICEGSGREKQIGSWCPPPCHTCGGASMLRHDKNGYVFEKIKLIDGLTIRGTSSCE